MSNERPHSPLGEVLDLAHAEADATTDFLRDMKRCTAAEQLDAVSRIWQHAKGRIEESSVSESAKRMLLRINAEAILGAFRNE